MLKKAGLIAIIAVAVTTGVAQAGTWRFALEEIDGSIQDIYAEEFKRRIEERSGGEVTVEIYPYGTLGTSSQLTELIREGGVQFAFASPGHLAPTIPEVGVFSLHFLFSDDTRVNQRVLGNTRATALLQAAYSEQNLQLLSVISEGWMAWTANRSIETPTDMQGLEIRTMPSPVLVETYRAYGADPATLPYAQVYSGLELEQIDAQVNPLFAIEEMGFHEVQDYLILARSAQFITTLVANDAFYEDLPEERQAMLDEVTNGLRRYIFEQQAEINRRRLESIKQSSDIKLIRLSDEQRAMFRERSLVARDVYIEQAGERGKQILNVLDEELRAAEATRKR
ncbi:tripartite ATP-independent transporter solute receptor, DctP family [Modicisalibacter muralis]|uniref:Tripartite ATP-independent transporter solute receptor, DctP family n=1 Tax=Modicisalibacter muralis TaxID=119000 RepID=A0A1G9NNH4_9GAMM|nr:TRAP transporter substrate-binding protein DctP [Halomonas muralis]SDL87914.1 tripartite ATP-independent transporter solute receptor, DctP family [Halomonas muralis]